MPETVVTGRGWTQEIPEKEESRPEQQGRKPEKCDALFSKGYQTTSP